MKLKNCTHGTLVVDNYGNIGMVVGITNNCSSGDLSVRSEPARAIPLVQFSGEPDRPRGIHHGNLEPLKDR